ERQQQREGLVTVDATEAGEGAVVAAVAAADGEDLRAAVPELACDLLDRGNRLGDADRAVLADQLGEPPRALVAALPVRPRVRVDDDADPGHVRPPRARRPAARMPPGCPARGSRARSR